MTIRVLVAGLGNMGRSHALAYHKDPAFQIVGLVNRSTPALPEVLFHVVRESTWKTFPPALRAQWTLVTDLTAGEKAAWLSSLKLDLPGEGRDEFFEKTWFRLGPIFSDLTLGPDLLVENHRTGEREREIFVHLSIDVRPRAG